MSDTEHMKLTDWLVTGHPKSKDGVRDLLAKYDAPTLFTAKQRERLMAYLATPTIAAAARHVGCGEMPFRASLAQAIRRLRLAEARAEIEAMLSAPRPLTAPEYWLRYEQRQREKANRNFTAGVWHSGFNLT